MSINIFGWSIFGMFYFAITIITIGIIFDQLNENDISFFNPVRNYKKWVQFNWFGIFFITLFLNIILLPYAVCYWIYKLFTIGRK